VLHQLTSSPSVVAAVVEQTLDPVVVAVELFTKQMSP
jgi:hypothetical protein